VNCPKCLKRMNVYNSYPLGSFDRYREYVCDKDSLMYSSIEKLEGIPLDKREESVRKAINVLKNRKGK